MGDDRTEEEQIRDVIDIVRYEHMRARDLDRARRAGRRKKCAGAAEVPSQESSESAGQSPPRESPPPQKPYETFFMIVFVPRVDPRGPSTEPAPHLTTEIIFRCVTSFSILVLSKLISSALF